MKLKVKEISQTVTCCDLWKLEPRFIKYPIKNISFCINDEINYNQNDFWTVKLMLDSIKNCIAAVKVWILPFHFLKIEQSLSNDFNIYTISSWMWKNHERSWMRFTAKDGWSTYNINVHMGCNFPEWKSIEAGFEPQEPLS